MLVVESWSATVTIKYSSSDKVMITKTPRVRTLDDANKTSLIEHCAFVGAGGTLRYGLALRVVEGGSRLAQ